MRADLRRSTNTATPVQNSTPVLTYTLPKIPIDRKTEQKPTVAILSTQHVISDVKKTFTLTLAILLAQLLLLFLLKNHQVRFPMISNLY